MTTGIINGHNLRLYIGGVAVTKSTSCTMSVSVETRTTTHKDSGTYEENEAGKISWEMTTDALVAFDSTQTPQSILTTCLAGTAVTARFSTEVTGDAYQEGSGIITSFTQNAPDNENVTFSITIKGSGALTLGTVS